MPYLDRSGYRIYYCVTGNPDAPPLILSHSLGATSMLWSPQLPAFEEQFRIIIYDHPGHGFSPNRPVVGKIADYGEDVLALMDELKLEKAHFCGLSLGGMVGIQLGAFAGERFRKLVLCSTTAKIEDPTLLKRRVEEIRRNGLAGITESVLEKWLTPDYRSLNPKTVEWVKEMFGATTADGYADTAEMICSMDLRPSLEKITNEILVIYGVGDEATPPTWNKAIAEGVRSAECLELESAHLSNIERSLLFSESVKRFLS